MERIDDPVAFFDELGGLHDAAIEWAAWESAPDAIRLVVDNLNAASMDGVEPSPHFPGYRARPATIVFSGAGRLTGHMNPAHGGGAYLISDMTVERSQDRYKVKICGIDNWVWLFECDAVGLEPAGEPASVSLHYELLKAQVR